MTKKKRTVITEESHEIWIIRHRSGEPAERTQSENNSTAMSCVLSAPPPPEGSETGSNSGGASDSPIVTKNADYTGSAYENTED